MFWKFDGFELDEDRYELRCNGTPQSLEPQVLDLLIYLVKHHDRIVPRNEILDHIWPERYITEAALNSRVMSARRAIGDNGSEQRLIKTIHGRGFRFVGTVEGFGADGATTGSPVHSVSPAPAALRQEIRFCKSRDGATVAYATTGSGPPIVKAPNWMTHLEYDLESPIWGHLVRELASRRTLVRMDQRGCGLGDWDVNENSFEHWVDDLGAVIEASGIEPPFPLVGISQGGPIAATYAARHPEKVSRLALVGAYARGWGKRDKWVEEREAMLTLMRTSWGRSDAAFRHGFSVRFVPSMPPEAVNWLTELQRISTSAENAARIQVISREIDVTGILSKLSMPALVMHASRDHVVPFAEGRLVATLIPGARFVSLDSDNHLTLETEPAWEQLKSELWEFLDDDSAD